MSFTKVVVEIEGVSPYSQSLRIPSAPRGKYDEHEEANWLKKAHINSKGFLCIPAAGVATGLASAVRLRGTKVKGNARTSLSTLFRGGVMVEGDLIPTSVKSKDVRGEWIDSSPQGKPGQTGVMRKFPVVDAGWRASFKIAILNSQIPVEDVIQAIHDLGVIVGLGRWRPEKGGKNGRFRVLKHDVVEEESVG